MCVDENYRELICAIIGQALEDYRVALLNVRRIRKKISLAKREHGNVDELELSESKAKSVCNEVTKFMHSNWFATLTNLDGDMLLKGIEDNITRKKRSEICHERSRQAG